MTVAEAASKMDTLGPGWAARIEKESLQMMNAQECVVGQGMLNREAGRYSEFVNRHFAGSQSLFTERYKSEWITEIDKRIN